MPSSRTSSRRTVDHAPDTLCMPTIRCLTKAQAAAYFGIGVTLFESQGVGAIKFGRRTVYDRLDLDEWLDKYKCQSRGGITPQSSA